MDPNAIERHLLDLAADLGDGRQMAIFGEGNISGKLDERRFLVKASGTRLSSLYPEQLVELDNNLLLNAVASGILMSDEEIEALLMESRVYRHALKPSVESLFHAWLLHLPGVQYVGHVHATAVNQILCSPAAEAFATKRLFPDHIVYCGVASVLVPYVDPGLTLSREIALRVQKYRDQYGTVPKTILLENHGIIGLGARHTDVMAAIGMAEKAAHVFIGATALGGPVYMDPEQVERIAGRSDEHYRQHMLLKH